MTELPHSATTEEVPKLDLVQAEIAREGIRHIAHIQTFILYAMLVDALLLFVIGVELGVIAYLIGR